MPVLKRTWYDFDKVNLGPYRPRKSNRVSCILVRLCKRGEVVRVAYNMDPQDPVKGDQELCKLHRSGRSMARGAPEAWIEWTKRDGHRSVEEKQVEGSFWGC